MMGGWLWLAPSSALFAAAAHCPTCGRSESTAFWLTVGFVGQAVFTARFLAQWIASERKKDSVVPVVFWWLSLVGGLTLLAYASHRRDPVIVVGQSMGVFIYVRNLMLVAKGRRRASRHSPSSGEPAAPPSPSPSHRVDPAEDGRGVGRHGRGNSASRSRG